MNISPELIGIALANVGAVLACWARMEKRIATLEAHVDLLIREVRLSTRV